jgi:hypothetical protein
MTTETIRDVDQAPSVRAAKERLVRAQLELAAVEGDIVACLAHAVVKRDRIGDAARQFLEGGEVDEGPNTTQYEDLCRQRRVLRRAVEIATGEVGAAQQIASRELAPQLVPRHRELVRRLGLALVEAGRAEAELEAFYHDLRGAGLEGMQSLLGGLMHFGPLRQPVEKAGRVEAWFCMAIEAGFLAPGDVPAEWVAAWGTPPPWERSKPAPAGPIARVVRKVTGWVDSADN